jgi:uncharacterized protein YcfJ
VEVCHYENRRAKQTTSSSSSTQDKIIGGIIGGAAGSAIGGGSGRDAAAGVGVLLGSEIAADDGGITEGEIIGGIAGGIIGNQVGGGSGKTAATGVGVLIGSIVGNQLQNGATTEDTVHTVRKPNKKRRVCVHEERPKKIITGYDVTYEYSGRSSNGYLPYRPGEFVDVSVNFDIVEDRTETGVNY